MATTTVDKAIETLAQSMLETNQAVAENFVEAQKRTIEFAEDAIEQGINVLRENLEGSSALAKQLIEERQKPQDAMQAALDTAASAWKRRAQYAEHMLEDGSEMLKGQINSARSLAQTAIDQSQRRQEAYRSLFFGTIDSSLDLLTTPYAYAKRVLETTESIALRSVDAATRVTKQGLETVQQAAQRTASAVEQATDQAAEETHKSTPQAKQAAPKTTK